MSKVHLARSGFITKAALPSITRQRGTTTGSSNLMLFGAGKTTVANNTTFIDSSANAFTITRNGNTVHSGYNPFSTVSDGSAYFDGTGDYLTIPNNSGFQLGSGNFTIENWVNFSSLPTSNNISSMVGLWDGTPYTQFSYLATLYNNSGTYQLRFFYSTNGSSASSISVNWTPSLNTWYHIAFVRSSNSLYIFVDGTQIGSTGSLTATLFASTQYLIIGSASTTEHPLNGYLSNVRLVKGTAVYTSNFTPPTSALTAITNTQLLLLTDNYSIVNSTPTPLPVTIVGNTTISTAQFPTGMNRSIFFDGTGDWLTLATNTIFDQTVDFTVEAFVRFAAVPTGSFGNYGLIFGQESTNMIKLGTASTGSGVFAFGVTKSGVGSLIVGTTSVSLNTWYHVALVKSGTGTNNIKLYVNGIQEGQATGGTAGSSTTVTFIGREGWTGDPAPLNGYISNLRYVKNTAVYTANFTAPSAPLSVNISVPAFVTNAIYGVNQLA
jgi:hypothetical protein